MSAVKRLIGFLCIFAALDLTLAEDQFQNELKAKLIKLEDQLTTLNAKLTKLEQPEDGLSMG